MNKVGKTTRPFRYDLHHIPYNYTVEVTKRFKGLDLVECLKNYGRRFVTLYRRKRKAKWLSEEALQIAEKRREARQRRSRKIYYLNAEFQRIARRVKKAFLSDQGKEIEENNRMAKTRDFFKKMRDTKGIFHANRGTIKDRSGMDLTEADHIKKRWQE